MVTEQAQRCTDISRKTKHPPSHVNFGSKGVLVRAKVGQTLSTIFVMTVKGRVQRKRDKHGFWTYRWVHLRDPSSNKTYALTPATARISVRTPLPLLCTHTSTERKHNRSVHAYCSQVRKCPVRTFLCVPWASLPCTSYVPGTLFKCCFVLNGLPALSSATTAACAVHA